VILTQIRSECVFGYNQQIFVDALSIADVTRQCINLTSMKLHNIYVGFSQ
jgi:hypothetical protein